VSHPLAVCEKAQSLEQLLQRLESGERLISVRAELELDVKAADVPHLRAKYEASGQTWESLLDGRYGHPQTAHSALREWMYQRKREDPTLTAGQLAEAVAAQFGVRLSAGHVNYLLRKVELTRAPGRPYKTPADASDASTPTAPPELSSDQAGLFFPRGGQASPRRGRDRRGVSDQRKGSTRHDHAAARRRTA
jgi:transposase